MDYSKLVDLYLEGELSSLEKDLLFKELSQNQSLRDYLEEQLRFNQFIQKDLQSISVPSDVTNNIFASLNFSIPNEATLQSPPFASSLLVNIKHFLGKYVPYLASSIVGGFVTFLLLWLILPLGKQNNDGSQIDLSQQQGIQLGIASEVPKISTLREEYQNNLNSERIIRETIEKWLSNYFKNLTFAGRPEQHRTEEPNRDVFSQIEPSAYELTTSEIAQNNQFVKIDIPILPTKYENSFLATQNNTSLFNLKLRNLTLGFRGYVLKSEPEVNVNLLEKGILPNIGLSVGYNFGKNTNIGFEFGQEKFAQKYTLIRDGEINYYKQNPLLWWYGFYLQQSISNLFQIKELKPMARLFIGGTPVGPLARGAIGLQYTPDARVSLYLGWEGTVLGYKVQNNIYQTKKSGLTYGISVRY